MKQANNNEVDLLLRSLARRARDTSPSPGGSTSGSGNSYLSEHLDADELNSYAEGVIPGPARARYTEHLADCQRCRRILVGLMQASAATRPYEVIDEQRGLGVWHGLAAFFSRPVLRYALPALALTAVIAISVIALWQQRRAELVAQNQPANSSAASSESGPTELLPTNEALPTQESSTPQRGIESKANSDSIREKKDVPAEKGEVARSPRPSASTNEITSSSLAKDSTQPGQGAGVAGLRPSYAPEPPPAAAPSPPRPMIDEADKIRTIQKEQSAEREDQGRQREQKKGQLMDTTTSNSPSKTGGATLKARRTDELRVNTTESRSGGKDKNESRNEVETNVSGRHFRRQGNAWIDTAYESSRATINVARSSEQFRSLVADEPGIRAIAERLSGEVIVVWKGRAYRIR